MNRVYGRAVHESINLIKHWPSVSRSRAEIRSTEGVSFVLILAVENAVDGCDLM
jgi:hypothetical protein